MVSYRSIGNERVYCRRLFNLPESGSEMTQTVFDQIQAQPGWNFHLPNDGSKIGGIQPTTYGFEQGLPEDEQAMLVFVGGVAYATYEVYKSIPLPINAVSPSIVGAILSFDLMPDARVPTGNQILETDFLYTSSTGLTHNCSIQRLFTNREMMQVSDQNGSWIDTGFIPPPLTADIWHSHKFYYSFDLNKGKYGTQAMQIDGATGIVPYALQGLTPIAKGWAPGLMLQIQTTLNSKPGASSFKVRNMKLVISQ